MFTEYTGSQKGFSSLVMDMKGVHQKLCKIVDILSTPKKEYDYEVVCISNDGGLTKVHGILVFDETTITSPAIYLNGVDVSGSYIQVPCNTDIKYDYEETQVCVDGKTWTKVKVWDKTNDSTPNLVTILWLNELDAVVSAPDSLLIDNVNCKEQCTPSISYAFANDLSLLLASNTFTVENQNCCSVKVITSIGEFIVLGNSAKSTEKIECEFTINSVELLPGKNCDLNKVLITGYKIK